MVKGRKPVGEIPTPELEPTEEARNSEAGVNGERPVWRTEWEASQSEQSQVP